MFLFVLTPGFWSWEFLVVFGLTVLVSGMLDLEFCGFWFLCFFIFGLDFFVWDFWVWNLFCAWSAFAYDLVNKSARPFCCCAFHQMIF